MTLVGAVHGLSRQWVHHVDAMLPDEMALTVGLGGESDWTSGTFEWFLSRVGQEMTGQGADPGEGSSAVRTLKLVRRISIRVSLLLHKELVRWF